MNFSVFLSLLKIWTVVISVKLKFCVLYISDYYEA